MRQYTRLPDIVAGAALEDPRASWFSVIVPIERTNMVTNPSFETGTTGWSAVASGSLSRTAARQYHGAYSLAVFPGAGAGDGASYDLTLVSGRTYAISAKVFGQAGVRYQLSLATTGNVDLANIRWTGDGTWRWVWCYYKEPTGATRRIIVKQLSSPPPANRSFYVDGVQCEYVQTTGDTVSTYIDGDQVGLVPNQYPPAYYWTGTPHASTSVRSGLTRAGGMVMPLGRFGFLLTAIVGLGLIPPQITATPFAQLDGAQYMRTRKAPRTFTLIGRIDASTPGQLDRQRGALGALLDRDASARQQPLMLRYQKYDGVTPIGDAALIPALYAGGLDGNQDNLHAEQLPISFTMQLPLIVAEGGEGAAIEVQTTVTTNRIAYRDPAGTWASIGTGAATQQVTSIAQGLDGKVYIGGGFSSFNGVANTKQICVYDPATGSVAALGTGGSGGNRVNRITVAPGGAIWITGDLTSMGGVAGADYVAYWDGSWHAVGTPPGAVSTSLNVPAVFDASGNFYYTRVGAAINKWGGASWTTLGTAAGGSAVIIGLGRFPNGDLIAHGNFTSVSAVSATNIIRYSFAAAAWQALGGTVPGSTVQAVGFDQAGTLYAGGATGGSSCLWVWGGSAWTQVGAITGGTLYSIAGLPDGTLLVSGSFTSANGVSLPDGLGIYAGSALQPLNVDLPGSALISVVRALRDGTIMLGFDQAGTATVPSASTTLVNSGTAKAYPTITIKGPSSGTSRIYEMRNVTTGRSILLNYTINAGETAVFRFDPTNLSFFSDFQGNLASKMLPGSSEADFFLAPGEDGNILSFFAAGSTVTAIIQWQPAYNAIADLTR